METRVSLVNNKSELEYNQLRVFNEKNRGMGDTTVDHMQPEKWKEDEGGEAHIFV